MALVSIHKYSHMSSTTPAHSVFLAFSFGTTLINEGHANSGQVINVFMAILIGSFSLALMAPEMQGKTYTRTQLVTQRLPRS